MTEGSAEQTADAQLEPRIVSTVRTALATDLERETAERDAARYAVAGHRHGDRGPRTAAGAASAGLTGGR